MSNLEQLTARILGDAKAKADQILEDAQKAAEVKIQEKKDLAMEQRKKTMRKASDEAELMKSRFRSNAELKIRNNKLQAKQEIIEKVLLLAKERLSKLEDEAYLAYLDNRLKGKTLGTDQLLLVQEGRVEKVKEHFANIKVSDQKFVSSGFMVQGKGIQENHTFDTYIDYMRDDLEGQLAEILFGGK